ncbi:MAG: phage tail protein [Candidatus Kapaibacterium sp.]
MKTKLAFLASILYLTFCAVMLAIGASNVRAQIPQVIAYQGYLSQGGAPYNSPSGGVPVTLILYNAPVNGSQVWSQTFPGVVVSNGYYSVIMDFGANWSNGYNTFNNQYYLSANVDNQLLSPRVQFTASPYSFNARIADSAIHVPQSPVGTIVAYAGSIVGLGNEQALGWYVCDGRLVARDSFPEYDKNVGTLYGSNNFGDSLALPDFRGLFLRGVNTGTGSSGSPYGERTDSLRDPQDGRMAPPAQNASASARGVGSVQMDAFKSHTHSITPLLVADGSSKAEAVTAATGGGWYAFNSTVSEIVAPAGGNETRPKNAYVYWLIKVR